jgi:FtsZ-interacting cell division protein ZipA
MTNKTIVIVAVVALVGAFAVGRWSAPEKVKIQTVEVEKKTTDKQVDSTKDKTTTITETTKPDGTKTKTTVITDNQTKHSDAHSDTEIDKTTTKEVDRSTSKVTISALAALDVTKPGMPIYGASVSKPILGPLTVGVFGFQNGMAGVSVGLSF